MMRMWGYILAKKQKTSFGKKCSKYNVENLQLVSGLEFYYYYICKRKLWLYSKDISYETDNDRVLEGTILHNYSYPRKNKREILLDNLIRFDIIENDYIIEVKISSKLEKADLMQLVYYLFYLKLQGIEKEGILAYTEERRKQKVILTETLENEIINTIYNIQKIKKQPVPPKTNKNKICYKCAYYNFCFAGEVNDVD